VISDGDLAKTITVTQHQKRSMLVVFEPGAA